MYPSSKLGLGTVQFGLNYGIANSIGVTPPSEAKAILDLALANQIYVLDTAHAYGESEKVLGTYPLHTCKLVTKFFSGGDIDVARQQFSESLERLNQSSVYGLLAHRCDEILENPEIWKWMQEQKESKLVEKIGVSFTEPEQIDELIESKKIPDLVQAPFNYLDRRYQTGLQKLRDYYGTEIHVRSVFLQGLFFMNSDLLPSFFDPIKKLLVDLQVQHQPLYVGLLQWVLQHNFIDKVIIGVNTVEQLTANLQALHETYATSLPELAVDIDSKILNPAFWPSNIKN